jgi:hypothetical protein
MATVYSLLCEYGQSTGSYFDLLSTEEKSRYGSVGSYRCYGSLSAWITARSSATTATTTEVLEIANDFDDERTSGLTITYASFGALKIVIHSKIDGVRTAAHHDGSVTGGYCLRATGGGGYYALLTIQRDNVTIDGIRFQASNTSIRGITWNCSGGQLSNNIIESPGSYSYAFFISGNYNKIFNNIAYNSYYSFYFNGYANGLTQVYNNLAIDGIYGFMGNYTSAKGTYYNNIAYGNTTSNWDSGPPAPDDTGMGYNAGESGDTPWYTGTDTGIKTITSSDFADYANQDFRLASGSDCIGAGFYNPDWHAFDILDDVRPNYNPSGEENWDIGPFEYDHGNGLAPETVTISITNIVENSVATLEETDGTVIIAPTTVGSSGIITDTYTYTTNTNVVLKVRKSSSGTKYLPFKMFGTITVNGLNMFVSQIEDTVAV